MNSVVNLKPLFVAGPANGVQCEERVCVSIRVTGFVLIVADVAAVHLRLVASVNQLVDVQVLLLEEALSAHVALEVALVAVKHDVLLQVFLPLERLVADVAVEVAFGAVRLADVRVAMRRLRELALAQVAPAGLENKI